MAAIKSFTDLQQSRKLAEILPIESADMYYTAGLNVNGKHYYKTPYIMERKEDLNEYTFPCWSLASLLEVLPYPQLSKDKLGSGKVGWMVSVYPNDCRYDSCWHDNPVDACVELIGKLNELNLI